MHIYSYDYFTMSNNTLIDLCANLMFYSKRQSQKVSLYISDEDEFVSSAVCVEDKTIREMEK